MRTSLRVAIASLIAVVALVHPAAARSRGAATPSDLKRAIEVATRARQLAGAATHSARPPDDTSPRFVRFRRPGKRAKELHPYAAVRRLEDQRPVEIEVAQRRGHSFVGVAPAVNLRSIGEFLDWADGDGALQLPRLALADRPSAPSDTGLWSTRRLFYQWTRMRHISNALWTAAATSFIGPGVAALGAFVAMWAAHPSLNPIGLVVYPLIAMAAGAVPAAGLLVAENYPERRAAHIEEELGRRIGAPASAEVTDWDEGLKKLVAGGYGPSSK